MKDEGPRLKVFGLWPLVIGRGLFATQLEEGQRPETKDLQPPPSSFILQILPTGQYFTCMLHMRSFLSLAVAVFNGFTAVWEDHFK
jgi:hypothetical protein